jgi:hypothetical protein
MVLGIRKTEFQSAGMCLEKLSCSDCEQSCLACRKVKTQAKASKFKQKEYGTWKNVRHKKNLENKSQEEHVWSAIEV